jgi:hypothetical protein
MIPLVCDLKDLEIKHFLCTAKSKVCELEIGVRGQDWRAPITINDRKVVFDLVATLCGPSPPPYRRDVYAAFYDLQEPFANVLKDLVKESKTKIVTLWMNGWTNPQTGEHGWVVPIITTEHSKDNHWIESQVAVLRERGYDATITTNPNRNTNAEVAQHRLCIRARKDGDEILITQTYYKKSKKPRLAFTTRIMVGKISTGLTGRSDEGNVFVQPVKTIFADGTFGSIDMKIFMGCFLAMEDAFHNGQCLKFSSNKINNIKRSRLHPSLVGGKAQLFTVEYLDAKDALNYFDLFGGEQK